MRDNEPSGYRCPNWDDPLPIVNDDDAPSSSSPSSQPSVSSKRLLSSCAQASLLTGELADPRFGGKGVGPCRGRSHVTYEGCRLCKARFNALKWEPEAEDLSKRSTDLLQNGRRPIELNPVLFARQPAAQKLRGLFVGHPIQF
jgi:hypothetical protein